MKPLGASDPTVLGPYRLLGVLGDGGMARVYLGQSPAGRRLAIKVIRPHLADDPAFRRRFQREIAAVRAVSPLFTAAVVDADTQAEAPWLATIYIDGPNLDEQVADHGPLAPEAVFTLAAGLAEALASIHRSGLIHRDLKPSNVILNDAGPRIIDFGAALLSDATNKTTSLVLGTPSYMAPERLSGGEVGPAADIFALGATLARAATGKPLVNRGTVYEQMFQITLGRFDLSAVPVRLRPVITRCLSQRPKDRPTADELVRYLVGAGVAAPEPGWYRTVAPARSELAESEVAEPAGAPRRSRRWVLSLGALVAIVAAGGVSAASGAFDQNSTEERAEERAGERTASNASLPGTVLWQAKSGAPATDGGPATQILVDRNERIITASGPRLRAVDRRGHQLWTRTLPGTVIDVRLWGDAVLATGTGQLWLLDPGNGKQRFVVDVAAAEKAAVGNGNSDNPDNLTIEVNALALAPDRAFLSLGTAMIAIDRNGRQIWRRPRPASPAGSRPPAASPHVASADWLVTRDVTDSTVEIGLYAAGTGDLRWSTRYDLPPQPPPPPPPPPPPDFDHGPEPGPGAGPGPGPGGPPPDADWQRAEGRIHGGQIVLRDGQALTVLRLSDGAVAWRKSSPTPIAAIEPLGELLVVSADRTTAYAGGTGAQAWQAPVRGAQLAVPADGRRILAVTRRDVSAIDTAGIRRWQAALPGSVAGSLPDRVTVGDRAVYVVFRPRPDRSESTDIDVVAFALDTVP